MKCHVCKTKSSIIGYCKYCELNFCINHRLPEIHHCCKLDNLIKKSKERLEFKLTSESMKHTKINYI